MTRPMKGETDVHIDVWVGYSRRLTDRINRRVQLNLRNVFEDTPPVPETINPDHTVASRVSSRV